MDTNATARSLQRPLRGDPTVPAINEMEVVLLARKNRRIIVEVKAVNVLRPRHITRTVEKYQYPYFPDRYDIIIPSNTKVLPKTRKLAKRKKVRIRRMWGYP